MHPVIEPPTTPPEPHPFYQRAWFRSYDEKRASAERRGLVELIETLEGKRQEFPTWTSSGAPTTYTAHELELELINNLPENFVARCIALLRKHDEQTRKELWDMVEPEITKMVSHYGELQAEHDATQNAMEALS